MARVLYVPVLALAVLFHHHPAVAAESKELRKQRQAAQKERQAQKNERNKEYNEATKDFREFVRDLKLDSREQLAELDTEFKLRRVELKAEHDARVAGAQAEYQKKMSGLFMTPGVEFNEQTIEKLQAEGKAFADELFTLRKQSAEELHREAIATEERKNALLTEKDRLAMDEAASLGLTKKFSPILATPIGDGLTQSEERWNEREQKEVEKLELRSRKTVNEFQIGKRLREWEIGNQNEDFKLVWDEKAELQVLDSEQNFYNILFMQAARGGQIDQQDVMSKMAEINEQKKLIGIKYRKIRDQNRIKRARDRKEMMRVK